MNISQLFASINATLQRNTAYVWVVIPLIMFICSIGMTFFATLTLLSGDSHGYAFLLMSCVAVFVIHQEGKRYKEELVAK